MPLHSKSRGSGEPLVLIHGLFGSLENLGAIARLLSEHYTVYSIDLPNHGRSPHTDTTDLDSMVAMLGSWIKQHKLSSAHIVGHSLGGKVAMELALTQPELVERLVVIDISPVGYDPHHNDVFDGLLAVDIDSISSRAEAEAQLSPYVPEFAVRSFLLKNLVKEPAGHVSWRMNLSVIHQGYPNLIRENTNASFPRPVLFLKGGVSDYIQEQHRHAILQRFKDTSLKIVANTGHWLHAEKPDIVAKMITKFLS